MAKTTTFKLELNIEGWNEARNAPDVKAFLYAEAMRIAEQAGGEPDFVVIDSSHASRARYVVVTATTKGRRDEAEYRVLSRAFGA